METRLSLRRCLLRIDDAVQMPQDTVTSIVPQLEDDVVEEKNEEASEEEMEYEESDGNKNGTKHHCGTRYPTAATVKVLYSRSDADNRQPTICFDYPSFLHRERDYTGQLVTTMNAHAVHLMYRTDWERHVVKSAFAAAGFTRTRKKWTQWHVAWAKPLLKSDFAKLPNSGQVFNHFPDPWIIGRKDRLLKLLTACRRRFGATYDFFPLSFLLPDQLDAFRRALEHQKASVGQESDPTKCWILKPPASACGRGIRILSNQAARHLCDKPATLRQGTKSKKNTKARIIQQYVAKPLFLSQSACYKFDLRLYVLVTSLDPLRIYLFQEGLVRFCTSPYSLENLHNRCAHLANYAINKNKATSATNPDAELACKWSLATLFHELQRQELVENPATLLAKIRAIICKTIIAAEAPMTSMWHQFAPRCACYELFGFDLMLDAEVRPWLLEVNVSPSVMGTSPLDRRIKGLLVSDIFHLIGCQVPLVDVPPGQVPSRPPSLSTKSTRYPLQRSKTKRGTCRLHSVVQDNSIDHFTATHLALFTPNDWDIVQTMDDEMDRKGHFDRIYPAGTIHETTSYVPFFTCQRYTNLLCTKWLQTPQSVRHASGRPKKPTRSI